MQQIPSIAIRPATDADIPDIAGVLIDTWRSTFRGLLSVDFLESMSKIHQVRRYRKILSRPQVCCFVAIGREGRVVGFCCGGPNRSTALQTPAEIYALYVRQSDQKAGLGRKLFDAVAKQLSFCIGVDLAVWVIESNPYRRFYERLGGQEIAREPLVLGRDTVIQIAYVWRPYL